MHRFRDSWRVQWRDLGRRRSRLFTDRLAAEKFELELRLGTADTTPTGRQAPTFESFAKEWLATVCRTEKAKTQWVKDEEVVRLHLVPAFGNLKLSQLRKAHALQLKAELRQKRAKSNRKKEPVAPAKLLSPKTANNVIGLAKRMLASAVDMGHIAENPFRGVRAYRLAERDYAFWTPEEYQTFVEKAEAMDTEFVRLVRVAAHTGLRLGELAALERRDLDFERGTIRVRGSWSVALQELTPTKGKEVATIEMGKDALTALAPKRFLQAGSLVFDRTLFWSARKRLGRLARRAGVPPIRFHDLRHSHASWLALAGIDLLKIQRQLRHKSYAMTLRYAHLHPSHSSGIAKALESLTPKRHTEAAEA